MQPDRPDTKIELQTATPPAENHTLTPIRQDERIQALDVVRGFALLGIFLMNVEWFNRPIAEIDAGLPLHAHGVDYFAGWMVYTFVRGKFWTMFSLLFGMGFAVMLSRAERAGRDFVAPYLRRIVALALIGAAHYILIWTGDILFSYSLGAAALMILFFAEPVLLLIAIGVSALLGAALGMDGFVGLATSLSVVALVAWYIRGNSRLSLAGSEVPIVSVMLAVVAVQAMVIGIVIKLPAAIFAGVIMGVSAWLAGRFHDPPLARLWRAGSFLYLAPFLAMALSGLMVIVATQLHSTPTAEQTIQTQKDRAEYAEDVREETAAMTGSSYATAVKYRAGVFSEEAGNDFIFPLIALGMFLIGAGFVRSGVMADTGAHLPLFRRMTLYGLSLGLGLSLSSSAIAVTDMPGQNDGPYRLAAGLQMLSNLPACLGYVGLLVLMLHSRGWLSRISILAPAGRMALTNYLCQSIVQSVFFYGYFLGHWGMPRAWQVVFVTAVYSVQVVISHWWLSRFRYGPMEWLWRAATYWRLPAMRRTASD